ncbi:peptidoglycan DD-metalloendopeptidase family protein [Undibacterium baiyunense]|nr:peptidoglycan DD-metalloendopeptidase family protein [Undibacterium baiyunense]
MSVLFVAACSSVPNQAPVIERSKETTTEPVTASQNSVAKQAESVRPSYVVKRGDSLSKIALALGLNMNDLIVWNNLANPSDIKVDQVLWTGPAGGSEVKITPITGNSGIEVRNLNPINPATHKTAPKGDKRPYSESNLAELQKSDGAISVASSTVKNDAVVVKPVEKPTQEVAPEIAWVWPTNGKVLSTFDDPKNKGIDIGGKLGQDIVAVAPGKVIYEVGAVRGYGNMLVITHANNYLSVYAHNKTNLVKKGQTVSKGQKIAEMGNSDSETVKLHFEIRQSGKPIDPLKLLPNR